MVRDEVQARLGTTIIAATKLTIPTPVRPVVARPLLMEALDEPSYRVGLVSAPAGFGKTALLATWAAGQGDSLAWLSCDATDAEPTRFWRGLLAAVAARRPDVGDDAGVLLERASADSAEVAISLANDLDATGLPMTIVIDDLHMAGPTPAALAALVTALPASVRLIIGSRVDPPLPLGRLRVAGELLELHSEELSFSDTETAAVLQINGVALEREEIERLHDLTEGWPAGVQLAALALQRDSNAAFLDAFASTDRAVADFLVGEVLDRLPEEVVEFLYATSVLDGFDASMCEAVTERPDAAAVLGQVVAAKLFVVRLDVGAGWYRYHHLFGAFLQARLRALGHDRWRAAHRRAARAFEARDDIANALHHAAASGDEVEAAAIVRRTLWRWITVIDADATNAVVRQWLHQFGRALIVTDPAQVLEFLVPLIATTRGDDVRWWLTEIEAAHPDASPDIAALLQACWAEHHLCRGEADDAMPRAQAAMDAVGGAPPVVGPLPALPTVLARAHLQADDPAAAGAVLDAVESHRTGHAVIDDVRVLGLRAWTAFINGELRRAELAADEACSRADEMELPASDPGRIFAGLSQAGMRLERNDSGGARQLLEQVRRDADLGRRPPLQSLVALQHARHARVVGDGEGAAEHLTLARLLLPTASGSVRSVFDVEAVRQAIEFRPSVAADLIRALSEGPKATLLGIRLALAEGDRRAAAALVDVLPDSLTARERVVRGVLAALTHLHVDVGAANVELHGALLVARSEGFNRTILGQGADVLKLLLSFTPTADLEPYVDELIEAASSVAAPIRPPSVTTLVDPLSDREVTVLRYLCSRLTNQEIASAIYVSHNTLKTHVSSVYRKLSVGTRRDAVETGRQLGII